MSKTEKGTSRVPSKHHLLFFLGSLLVLALMILVAVRVLSKLPDAEKSGDKQAPSSSIEKAISFEKSKENSTQQILHTSRDARHNHGG